MGRRKHSGQRKLNLKDYGGPVGQRRDESVFKNSVDKSRAVPLVAPDQGGVFYFFVMPGRPVGPSVSGFDSMRDLAFAVRTSSGWWGFPERMLRMTGPTVRYHALGSITPGVDMWEAAWRSLWPAATSVAQIQETLA